MRGSILLTFDEAIDTLGIDGLTISVEGQSRYIRFIDSSQIYTTRINTNQVGTISFSGTTFPQSSVDLTVKRIDYTTDDENNDNGIKETLIDTLTITGNTTYSFTATTRPDAYSFKYVIKIDNCFNIGTGFAGVSGLLGLSILETSDKKFIIGGGFLTYKSITSNRIIRLLDNGDKDGFIGTGFTGGTIGPTSIRTVSKQTNGKIICSGNFGIYNGTSVNNLCRLNTNGTLDTTFNSGGIGPTSAEGGLRNYVTDDDKVYIGGGLLSYNGSSKFGLLKLNSDGTIDNSWNTPTTFDSGGGSLGFAFAPQSSGKMIISQGRYYDTNINFLGRLNLDGTLDTTFNVGGSGFQFSGAGSPITDFISILPNDKLLVANRGKISSGTYNGTLVDYICKINSNGTLDSTFATSGTGFNDTIRRILQLPSGKIIVIGLFTSYNGTSVGRICRLNENGTLDTTFNVGGSGFTGVGSPSDIILLNDGTFIVVGNFTTYNGRNANGIVKLSPNGILFNC